MDALSEVLRLVQMTGAVFLNAELRAPWAVESPSSDVLAQHFLPEADNLLEYHFVMAGQCWIELEGDEPMPLAAGDLVIITRGEPHRMSSARGIREPAVMAADLHRLQPGIVNSPRYEGSGEMTRLVCGYLALDRKLCAPLLAALPRVLRLDVSRSELGQWIESYLRFRLVDRLEDGPGGACVLSKLSELMFVEAVRRYVESMPPGQDGWLAGLKDVYVGKALACLHGNPRRNWTVEDLAREVGLSRSALAERFTALVGRSPIQYLTSWRLALAARMMSTSRRPSSAVAFDVGYDSEAAFSKAFKREFGAPPSQWRRINAVV